MSQAPKRTKSFQETRPTITVTGTRSTHGNTEKRTELHVHHKDSRLDLCRSQDVESFVAVLPSIQKWWENRHDTGTRYFKTVEVFPYEDLSEDVKEKLRQEYREHDMPLEFFFEDAQMLLEDSYGIVAAGEDLQVSYGLNYCQGDGVVFEGVLDEERLLGAHPDLAEFVAHHTKGKPYELRIKIGHPHNLGFAPCTMTPDVEFFFFSDFPSEEADELMESKITTELENRIQTIIEDASEALARDGYSIIEEAGKDGTIDENLIANELLYTADGRIL